MRGLGNYIVNMVFKCKITIYSNAKIKRVITIRKRNVVNRVETAAGSRKRVGVDSEHACEKRRS